jgi:hypothetical protein
VLHILNAILFPIISLIGVLPEADGILLQMGTEEGGVTGAGMPVFKLALNLKVAIV